MPIIEKEPERVLLCSLPDIVTAAKSPPMTIIRLRIATTLHMKPILIMLPLLFSFLWKTFSVFLLTFTRAVSFHFGTGNFQVRKTGTRFLAGFFCVEPIPYLNFSWAVHMETRTPLGAPPLNPALLDC